jgi:hypothetical protein
MRRAAIRYAPLELSSLACSDIAWHSVKVQCCAELMMVGTKAAMVLHGDGVQSHTL